MILMCRQVSEPLVWTAWMIPFARKRHFRRQFIAQNIQKRDACSTEVFPLHDREVSQIFNDPVCLGMGYLRFYTHCGFEVKKLVEMHTQDPILEPFQPVLQEGKGKKFFKGLSPEKRKHQISPCLCWHLGWTFTACSNVQTGQKMHMIAL